MVFKNTDYPLKSSVSAEMGELINSFFSLVPEGIEISADTLPDLLSPRAFLGEIFSSLLGQTSGIISFLSFVVLWVIISYLATVFNKSSLDASPAISIVFALPVLEVLSRIAISLIESLNRLSLFFTSVIPIVSLIGLSSGAPTASRTQAVQMTVTSALINRLTVDILAPIALGLLALAITVAFKDSSSMSLVTSAKTVFTKILGFLTAVVGILFSLQSVIAVAADSAAVRLAKFSAQSMLPQIGGLVSSSLSALGAGLSYAKGVIGAGAIYVILIILLSPLPVLLCYRLCLSMGDALAKALGVSSVSSVISAYLSALDSLLSVYALSGILCLLEIILFMKSAVPIS